MDTVTHGKVKELEEQGFVITGYILKHPDGDKRAFIDHGRVRWLSEFEAQVVLGHRSKSEPILEEGEMVCPNCAGRKKIRDHHTFGRGWSYRDCYHCGRTGKIKVEDHERRMVTLGVTLTEDDSRGNIKTPPPPGRPREE